MVFHCIRNFAVIKGYYLGTCDLDSLRWIGCSLKVRWGFVSLCSYLIWDLLVCWWPIRVACSCFLISNVVLYHLIVAIDWMACNDFVVLILVIELLVLIFSLYHITFYYHISWFSYITHTRRARNEFFRWKRVRLRLLRAVIRTSCLVDSWPWRCRNFRIFLLKFLNTKLYLLCFPCLHLCNLVFLWIFGFCGFCL